jgi:caspase domain-containing protein
MKKPSSHKLIWIELGALLMLFALATLWAPALRSRAQRDNRQLSRDQSQQSNRSSEHRIALVIGNGAYTNAPPLKNPPNDARDMVAALKELGFDVTSGINVNQRDMKRLIREFGQSLKAGGSGLFYYAGHGVQSKGKNYLIPIEADIQSEVEVEDAGVDVNLVLGYMDDAQNGLNIVILDACRDNPFARSFRSAGKGLAQVDAPTGTLIAYATAPGRVASDGTDQNGLYTAELLKQMRVPGLSTTDTFMHVRAEVMKQTANKQVPWEASSLVGAFYFTAPVQKAAASPTGPTPGETRIDPKAVEREYWETIRNSTDAQDYKDYLQTYPNGAYAGIARAKVRQIEAAKSTTPSNTQTGGAGNETQPLKADGGVAEKPGVPSTQPQLAFAGTKSYEENGKNLIRYFFSVTNRANFPNEIFAAAPALPACGRNTNSSRTWIDVYDDKEKRFFGFCAVMSSEGLAGLYFNLTDGEAPPPRIFIVLTDRETNTKYRSSILTIPVPSKPNSPVPPDLKGLDILIYYRNMGGVNRLADANKMADRLKARGANVYLTLMDAKEFKGVFRYRQQDADIARRIMEFVADIESLKLEAAFPSPEFHIFLQ